ncbi:MAG TPA: type II secretion system protein GspJ [Candidatus Binatia bacterium]
MRPRPPARATSGFTLLEVVLSLVIFSFITLMIYGAFFIGHRAVLKGEAEAEVNQRMRVADDILGHQLRSTVFYFARHEEETYPFFIGRPDGMTFVSAAPQGHGGTGLAVVTYRAEPDGLVLEERADFTPQDLNKPPKDAHIDRAVLLSGFSSIRFEYLPHEEGGSEWQPNWDAHEEDTLPSAVRISIEGLDFFDHPWVREIPLMTIAFGWGNEDFQEPDDEDTDGDTGDGSEGEGEGEGDD